MTYKKNYLNKILVLCMLLVVSCEETSEPIDCVITVNQNGITFVDNKKFTGQCYIYAVDGKIVRLNSYKRGKPSGVHKAWYHPTGILAYEGSRKNGEIHGKYVGYHENGSIQAEGKLKKGFYAGKWKYYNDKGELILEKRFINGKAVDSTYINK
jgi:antitoxin component YwqK of YwqJK toxin-antitoxin module